jgi:hypothetical protein
MMSELTSAAVVTDCSKFNVFPNTSSTFPPVVYSVGTTGAVSNSAGKAQCAGYNSFSNLAILRDAATVTALMNWTETNAQYWIGLNYSNSNNVWIWNDGVNMSQHVGTSLWDSGWPLSPAQRACAIMQDTGFLINVDCAGSYFTICEVQGELSLPVLVV